MLTLHWCEDCTGTGGGGINTIRHLQSLVTDEMGLKLVNGSDFFNTAWQVVPEYCKRACGPKEYL